TAAQFVERHASRQGERAAILYGDRTVSWRELNEGANRYARWARTQGLKKGDVVALLMENRPEYLMAWLGLVKEGVIVALINTHLESAPLIHSLNISGARHVILGAELASAYAATQAYLETKPTVWCTGCPVSGAQDLDGALKAQSGAAIESPA